MSSLMRLWEWFLGMRRPRTANPAPDELKALEDRRIIDIYCNEVRGLPDGILDGHPCPLCGGPVEKRSGDWGGQRAVQ